MHRFIIFIMGGAIAALAVAVVSLSAVAIVSQAMALMSQCLIALGLFGLGVVIVGSRALRQRVFQVYLARQLLGADADRLLIESHGDRVETLPEMFPQQQAWLPPARPMAQTSQPPTLRPLPTLPVMPHGWGFDEED
jgi:hypothetical protein